MNDICFIDRSQLLLHVQKSVLNPLFSLQRLCQFIASDATLQWTMRLRHHCWYTFIVDLINLGCILRSLKSCISLADDAAVCGRANNNDMNSDSVVGSEWWICNSQPATYIHVGTYMWDLDISQWLGLPRQLWPLSCLLELIAQPLVKIV